jgi:hypothetical protein
MTLYKVTKFNTKTNEELDYGTWGKEDAMAIVKGYPFDGLMYTRKNSPIFFTIDEIQEVI